MSGALHFDDEASRRLEEAYTTDALVAQRRAVVELLALRPGERVLDVGVGPGLLAADLARQVGSAGRVCGVDTSDSMIALAGRRAAAEGSAPIELRRADAVALPYADATFDVGVTTQVLEYVADVPTALAELGRVLRPGGRVLVLDTDWDSVVWHSRDRARTERVLRAWEQHLADPHLPRRLLGHLERAGFEVEPVLVLPLLDVGYRPDAFSAGLLDLVAAFVGDRDGLTPADAEAWASDLRSLGREYFFSLNRYVFRGTRAG
ncbi:methyltransferase domain-containing protein [Geodermatophilus sp. CPCC 206100]|uniref:methyltransferase domain-containing protein n=1 Tax=Geodermatophilus sp. CPCC 206100 TaxID=3020054 RepID=UPI003B005105